MKRTGGALGILALALAAACGSSGTSGQGSKAQLPAVTIATANNMLHTAEFVGVEKGFFLKHGVKAKLQVLQTGSEITRRCNRAARNSAVARSRQSPRRGRPAST